MRLESTYTPVSQRPPPPLQANTSALSPEFYPQSEPVTHFPMVWDWHNCEIPGWDVTARCAEGSSTRVVVLGCGTRA